MGLENRIQALIAVGSSITANCQPCLQSTVAMALKAGTTEREIAEAIQVGKESGKVQLPKWTSSRQNYMPR